MKFSLRAALGLFVFLLCAQGHAALTNLSTWTLGKGHALIVGERFLEEKDVTAHADAILSALIEGANIPTIVMVESSIEKYRESQKVLAISNRFKELAGEAQVKGALDIVENLAHQSNFAWRGLRFELVDPRPMVIHNVVNVVETKILHKSSKTDARKHYEILFGKVPTIKTYLSAIAKLISKAKELVQRRQTSKAKSVMLEALADLDLQYARLEAFAAAKPKLKNGSVIDLVYAKNTPIFDIQMIALRVADPFHIMSLEEHLAKGERVVFVGGRMHALALENFLQAIGASNELRFGTTDAIAKPTVVTLDEVRASLVFFKPYAENHSFPKDPVCDQCLTQAKLSYCGACTIGQYCSPACQKEHWKVHKLYCATLGLCKVPVNK